MSIVPRNVLRAFVESPRSGELAKRYGLAAPSYTAVIESYQKAQEVAKQAR